MSLILDALRKSEAERRRGELPALAIELPPAHARPSAARTARWALPVAMLLAATAFWFAQRTPAPVAATVAPRDAAPPVAAIDPPSPTRVLPLQEPLPVAREPVLPAAPIANAPAPTTAPARTPVPDVAPAPVPLAELSADERRALPPLDLSMHLWSEDPARRFVILDGRRLAEGDRAGNAVVERIDADGVILAADGRRIRLPLH